MKGIILLYVFCITFCLFACAQNPRSFNFLLFIDKKIILHPAKLDFIVVDTWTNKQDTVKCFYNLSDVKIDEDDLEKIMKADSIYAHIEIQTNRNSFRSNKYDIKCYKRFYKLNYSIFEIYNLDKYGKKYDYFYYGKADDYCVMDGFLRKKKSVKYSNELKDY